MGNVNTIDSTALLLATVPTGLLFLFTLIHSNFNNNIMTIFFIVIIFIFLILLIYFIVQSITLNGIEQIGGSYVNGLVASIIGFVLLVVMNLRIDFNSLGNVEQKQHRFFKFFAPNIGEEKSENPLNSWSFKFSYRVDQLIYIFSSILPNIGEVFNFIKTYFLNLFVSENITMLLKYLAVLIVIIISSFLLSYAATDPNALKNDKTWVYIISIVVPLLLIMGYTLKYSSSVKSLYESPYLIFIISIIFIFFMSIFYFYSSTNLQTFTAISFGINVLLLLIFVIGLAIFFYMFSNYLKSQEGWTGFIIYFIFYIPCLLIEFFRYIRNEFAMTSNIVYIMFVVEIILILLYIYIPKLVNYIAYNDGITLLKDSVFLDSQQLIGNSEQFLTPSGSNGLISTTYNTNYTLSMWIYLNNQSPSYDAYAKETIIFDYGEGKPRITYFNNLNSDKDKDKYIIYFTNQSGTNTSYEITLQNQKWNYFVFNYFSEYVDLYINGILERTFNFKTGSELPSYNSTDQIVVGSNNGLDGAICNVHYFATPLSSAKIANTYNVLMYKNPPTVSLT
jgi:hypothetical protein